jgi:1,4-dihydroxy-2-naphthoate octaprenyltransferase
MSFPQAEQVDNSTLIYQTRWWQALNPAIYLVSVLPFLGVYLITDGAFRVEEVALATLAVVLLQHAINLFNDVSDWKLGADSHKQDSWVRVFDGNTRPVFWQGVLSTLAGTGLGVSVLIYSDKLWILYIALPMVLLGYLYNAGRRPLSYTALGEWVTGLCYGPGVFGCLFLLGNDQLTASSIGGMVTFGCLAMALLLSHQPPQIETDRSAGKHTFAVRYGVTTTLNTVRVLLLIAVIAFALALLHVGYGACAVVFVSLAAFAGVSLLRDAINPKTVLFAATAVLVFTLVVSFISPLI